jgi:hypothetical protein
VSFERPYGLAWLLQLGAELREWGSPEAMAWAAAIEPLERAAVARLAEWLPKVEALRMPGGLRWTLDKDPLEVF